jgi:hypothetical protein
MPSSSEVVPALLSSAKGSALSPKLTENASRLAQGVHINAELTLSLSSSGAPSASMAPTEGIWPGPNLKDREFKLVMPTTCVTAILWIALAEMPVYRCTNPKKSTCSSKNEPSIR